MIYEYHNCSYHVAGAILQKGSLVGILYIKSRVKLLSCHVSCAVPTTDLKETISTCLGMHMSVFTKLTENKQVEETYKTWKIIFMHKI